MIFLLELGCEKRLSPPQRQQQQQQQQKKKNLSDYLPHHSQVICCYQAADYLTLRRTRRAFAASAIFSQMIARLFVDVLPGWHSAEICLRGCFFASG